MCGPDCADAQAGLRICCSHAKQTWLYKKGYFCYHFYDDLALSFSTFQSVDF